MIRSIGVGFSVASLALVAVAATVAEADDFPTPKNTQAETIRLRTPEEAVASIALPDGFRATLFASEPQVNQPIALATDTRGRIWVAENNTYSDHALNFDMSLRDRILILEDADHDGKAEKRTVFWDKAEKLTSVEIGVGGVWALCPPQLLFLPDADGDDRPDGPPQVVLDGFDDGVVRHNIANGLRWGPDGWLYGRHGIQATSRIGAPGTPAAQRTSMNAAIWRYHPTRKLFEVVCRGTTNSWGMDWDQHGELFFINTVIGHLWHAIPGAFFERMYGEHANPHLYRLIGQVGDHVHWDTAETWSDIRHGVSQSTAKAGGGHAHAGMIIYQGDNWPQRYRGTVLTANFHGRRLNNDTLARQGAGYVGKHAPDLMQSSDPWFRVVELMTGADGGVYLADWSDIGECHDNDGIHRTSGRIYKIRHGQTTPRAVADVAKLDEGALIDLLKADDAWSARQALRALQDRTIAGQPLEAARTAARSLFESDPSPLHQLRAFWALNVMGAADENFLIEQLGHKDEHVRVWAIRALADGKAPTSAARSRMVEMAAQDPSGLVLVYLALTLQRLDPSDRWPLAEALAQRSAFAQDATYPLMVWFGLEAAVPENPERALALAGSSAVPFLVRATARRLTENLAVAPQPVDRLVSLAASADPARSREVLAGMTEALKGWRKAPMPASWQASQAKLSDSADPEVATLARDLAVVFGDGRALRDVLALGTSKTADLAARRDALRVLVEARASEAVPLLRGLVTDRDLGADSARGLAAFDDPAIAPALVKSLPNLNPDTSAAAIITLSARPTSARLLLDAISQGKVDRARVPAFQVRQMAAFPDDEVRRQVAALWPELKEIPAAKRDRMAKLKASLDPLTLATADLSNGRRVYARTCASCHVLYGQGGKIGPELTGSQRASLDYLVENVIDPSASVAHDYRMATVALEDGRLLNGIIVGPRDGSTLTLQTPTERLVVDRGDVEGIKDSELSLMPEGQIDVLSPADARDLFGYLMAPGQVPLPADEPAPAARR